MTKTNDYDIDLILSNEEFKKNREKCLKQEIKTRKKYKLRGWVKNLLFIILGAVIAITIYQLYTLETSVTTPAGSYKCHGGIIKICSSDKAVEDYLGV